MKINKNLTSFKYRMSYYSKRFMINGPISSPSLRESFYFVDTKTENSKELIPAIQQGKYVVYYGIPGTGKTTSVFQVMEELQEDYYPLYIDLERGVSFQSKQEFWKSIKNQLTHNNKKILEQKIEKEEDFYDFLDDDNQEEYFQKKKVILFIDNLNLMNLEDVTNSNMKSDFIRLLYHLDAEKKEKAIQSIIGIGSPDIQEYSKYSKRNFQFIKSKFFTEEQVLKIFDDFKSDYGNLIDEKIPEQIYKITSGYQELVSLSGKFILDELLIKKGFVSFQDWEKSANLHLLRDMPKMRYLKDLITLLNNQDNVREKNLLLSKLLRTDEEEIILTDEERFLGERLETKGALLCTNQRNGFKISCPLVKQFIRHHLTPSNPKL